MADITTTSQAHVIEVLVMVSSPAPCCAGAMHGSRTSETTECYSISFSDTGQQLCSGVGAATDCLTDKSRIHEHCFAMAGLEPDEFVEDMKKKGIRVPGIGHRIKSKVGIFLVNCDSFHTLLTITSWSWRPRGSGGKSCLSWVGGGAEGINTHGLILTNDHKMCCMSHGLHILQQSACLSFADPT